MKQNNHTNKDVWKITKGVSLSLVVMICLALFACSIKPAVQPDTSDSSSVGSSTVSSGVSSEVPFSESKAAFERKLWVDYLFDLCYILQHDFPSNDVNDSPAIIEYALLKAYRDNVTNNDLPPIMESDNCRLEVNIFAIYAKKYFNIDDISKIKQTYFLSADGSYLSGYVADALSNPDDTLTNNSFSLVKTEQPDNETVYAYILIDDKQRCVTLKKNGEGGYYIKSVIAKSITEKEPVITGSCTKFDHIQGMDAYLGSGIRCLGKLDGYLVLSHLSYFNEEFIKYDLNNKKVIDTLQVSYNRNEQTNLTTCKNDMLYIATDTKLIIYDKSFTQLFEYKLPQNDYPYSFYFNGDSLHMRMVDREAVLDKSLEVTQAKMLPSDAVNTCYEFNNDLSLLAYVNDIGLYLYDYATSESKLIAPHPYIPKGDNDAVKYATFYWPSFINEGKTIECEITAYEGVYGHLLYNIPTNRCKIVDMFYWEGGGIDIDNDYLYYYSDYSEDADLESNIKINLDDLSTQSIPPPTANYLQEMYSAGRTPYYFSCGNRDCYYSCSDDAHVKTLYKKNDSGQDEKTDFSIQGAGINTICDDGSGRVLAVYYGVGAKGYLIIDTNP